MWAYSIHIKKHIQSHAQNTHRDRHTHTLRVTTHYTLGWNNNPYCSSSSLSQVKVNICYTITFSESVLNSVGQKMSIIPPQPPPPLPPRHIVYWESTLLYRGISLLTCRIRIIWSCVSGKSLLVAPRAKAVGTLWSLPISTRAVPLFHGKHNVINFHKPLKWSRHLWMHIF